MKFPSALKVSPSYSAKALSSMINTDFLEKLSHYLVLKFLYLVFQGTSETKIYGTLDLGSFLT